MVQSPSPASTLVTHLRAALPTVGVVLTAFVVGGLVIAATGRNPLSTYSAIWSGAGLDWLLPGISADERVNAGYSLQQTLLLFVPLVLLGLAVSIPFKAGLFNIGGQGQYLTGSFITVWLGSSLEGLPAGLHIFIALAGGASMGALWASIAGLLKAYASTNEVISTIMLNYIAIWVGSALFGIGGPWQNSAEPTQPVSDDVLASAKLPVIWGDAGLQGLHAGIFVIPIILFFAWILISRTVLGFEIRATGSNPQASRYVGVSVRSRYVLAMALAGLFAGLAGAIDVLGWQYRVATLDLQLFQLGFLGIAVALLGRNNPIGIALAALLFAVLLVGSSVRNLDPSVFPPQLAGNLTLVIQAIIIILISVNASLLFGWFHPGRLFRRLGGGA